MRNYVKGDSLNNRKYEVMCSQTLFKPTELKDLKNLIRSFFCWSINDQTAEPELFIYQKYAIWEKMNIVPTGFQTLNVLKWNINTETADSALKWAEEIFWSCFLQIHNKSHRSLSWVARKKCRDGEQNWTQWCGCSSHPELHYSCWTGPKGHLSKF